MKLNNKGFAVTTILYTLLIAFLMFLGAALAMFSTSSSLISNANEDLINGTELNVQQVKLADTSGLDYGTWFGTTVLVKINSRYGTMYWPRDFYNYDTSSGNIGDPKSTLQKVENAESDINANATATTTTTATPNSPKTGDEAPMALLATLMLLSGGIGVYAYRKR